MRGGLYLGGYEGREKGRKKKVRAVVKARERVLPYPTDSWWVVRGQQS